MHAISVVITNYHETAPVGQCVNSILAQAAESESQIIVVCHGPAANTVRQFPEQVELIRTPSESLSDARNLGLDQADGEVVCFIDDDAEASPEWIRRTRKHFEDSALMLLGGLDRPHPHDSSLARAARLQENFFRLHLTGFKAQSLRFKGANLVIRRSLRGVIGGFRGDGDYYGAEDTDFVERAIRAKVKVLFDPDLVVYHHGPSLRQILKKRMIELRRGRAPHGLYTTGLASAFIVLLVLVGFLFPRLLLPCLLLSVSAWLALGVSIVFTQHAMARDLPGVLVVTGLEFALLPIRGLFSRLKSR